MPVGSEDALAGWVGLAAPRDVGAERFGESEVEATDPGEQGTDIHAAPFRAR
jgi:hypothetical protein